MSHNENPLPYNPVLLVKLITATVVVYCALWFGYQRISQTRMGRITAAANANVPQRSFMIPVIPGKTPKPPKPRDGVRRAKQRKPKEVAEHLLHAVDDGITPN